VVDEHLDYWKVTRVIARWITAEQIGYELGHKSLTDENIRTILHQLKRRTLVTIDDHFYKREYCDKKYCLIYFDVPLTKQDEIPDLFRRLIRLAEFKTSKNRMGKVIRVSRSGGIYFFDSQTGSEKHLSWTP
jgi:hypothetical protein